MSRGKGDGDQKKRLVTWIVVLGIICGCVYLYSRNSGTSALEYGSKSLRKLGSSYLGGDDDGDEASSKSGSTYHPHYHHILTSLLAFQDLHCAIFSPSEHHSHPQFPSHFQLAGDDKELQAITGVN
ncbi:hypothetical protein NC652_014754 [Populus alba x Populus x berolinensis]|nr:hypothetical protein NC652_014754 [Populus alba x Populus x berolinensis]